MKTKTTQGYTLSAESTAKITRIAEQVNKSRSMTLECILMSMTDNQLLRHARRKPVYSAAETGAENEIDRATTATAP